MKNKIFKVFIFVMLASSLSAAEKVNSPSSNDAPSEPKVVEKVNSPSSNDASSEPKAAEDVKSLRKKNMISNISKTPEVKKWVNNDVIVKRQYVQQPPVVPHNIENYRITLKSNKCLGCHSWQKAAETGATKVSLTHFKDRDGKELSNISARRYFCNQCHVPQKNAAPLIENEYKSVDSLK